MSDLRKLMAPYRLLRLLFVRYHKILWIAATLDFIFETENRRSLEDIFGDRNEAGDVI